jgi:CheY-like chemotaxis protein
MTNRKKTAARQPSANGKSAPEAGVSRTAGLETILDCIPDPALVVCANDAAIAYCNAAAVRWYGGNEGDLKGKPFGAICADTKGCSRQSWLGKVQVQGQVFLEQVFRLADGQIVRADISASTLKGEGLDGLVIAILRDAEARLAAQQQEIQSREIAARLVTIERISHEINNPLQALILRPPCQCDAEVQCHVDAIADAVRRLRAEESARRVKPRPARTDAPHNSPGTPANENRFLIADDTECIREALSLLLARVFPDVRIEKAADGEEALALFKKFHPSVIVLDMAMPKKTGEAVFLEIREHCRQRNIEEPRIIFCTGYTPPLSIMQAVKGSARLMCLLKPVPPDDIIEAVAKMAGRRTVRL